MNDIRDIYERVRRGQSDRSIAGDLHLSRVTVRKYREALAGAQGEAVDELLRELTSRDSRPTQTVSSVEPYETVVADLLDRGVETMTIYDRLRAEHGYSGSYSSVRRFVNKLRPPTPDVTVRVHTGPGEEAQVDFGAAGTFFDPGSQRVRPAYVFVMTLSYSRHQYAELVFDQKIPTWLALHRRAFASFGGVVSKVVHDYVPRHIINVLWPDALCGRQPERVHVMEVSAWSPATEGT